MAKKKKTQSAGIRDYGLILEPIITEKSSMLDGGEGSTIAFKVDPRADKLDIKTSVERVFGVEVEKVRTANILGKLKRTTRSIGRRAKYKKAYVTLKAGQTIDIVEGL